MDIMSRRAFVAKAAPLAVVPAVAASAMTEINIPDPRRPAPASPSPRPDPELYEAARAFLDLMDRLVELQVESDRLYRRYRANVDAGRPTRDPERERVEDMKDEVEDAAEAAQHRLNDLLAARGLAGCILDGVFFYGPLCRRYGRLDWNPDLVQPIALSGVVNLDAES